MDLTQLFKRTIFDGENKDCLNEMPAAVGWLAEPQGEWGAGEGEGEGGGRTNLRTLGCSVRREKLA